MATDRRASIERALKVSREVKERYALEAASDRGTSDLSAARRWRSEALTWSRRLRPVAALRRRVNCEQ